MFFTGNRNFSRVEKWEVILVFLFIGVLSFAVPVEARTGTLYKGNTVLGSIPVADGERGIVISIADAGALLGLNASVAGEELSLSRGASRLKIVVDAVAAWHNTQLIPLYGASYVQNGKWWLDVPSSVSLLQRFAGQGNGNKLRVEDAQAKNIQAKNVQVKDVREKVVKESSKGSALPEPTDSLAFAQRAENPSKNRVVVVSEPVKAPSAKAQPSPQPQAEILGIRWSTSREKIRLVADCGEGTNPEVHVASGKVSMTFTKMSDNFQGLPSPYDNVKSEFVKDPKGPVTFTFSVTNAKVEKLLLDNPRRLVLDFIFTSPTVIQETAPVQHVKQASTANVPHTGGLKTPKKTGKLLVVLDPGHGGKDPGAVGNGFKEKDINLALGLKMEKALQTKGFDVKMTRKTDVYLKLQERTDIANNANADMFVSIHVNSLPPGKNSAGFEIYLMALPTDKDALALAKIENREYVEDKSVNGDVSDRKTELLLKILGDMQQNNKINESTVAAEVLFKAGNRQNIPMKRVAQAPFFVLRGAAMPAVLLETGFITNAQEAKLLAHPAYQQKIADAMADGIYRYLRP